MSAGWTRALTDGLAAFLAAGTSLSWRPEGAYLPGEVGIHLPMLPDRPDRAVALSLYLVDAEVAATDVLAAVQVRCRGTSDDPGDVDDLSDEVFGELSGAQNLVLGQAPDLVHVQLVWMQSHANLGPDPSGRYESTTNYYVRAVRPTRWRNDD